MNTLYQRLLICCACAILVLSAACASGGENIPSETKPVSLAPTHEAVEVLQLPSPTWTATAPPTATATLLPPTPTPTPTATPADTSLPTSTSAPTEPPCTNQVEFVRHLTAANNTAFDQNASFGKLWRIKNTGTCTWTTDYTLVLVDGEAMSGPTSIPLPAEVPPGGTVDLRVNMYAPVEPGIHTNHWALQTPSGTTVAISGSPNQVLETIIRVIDPNAPKPYQLCG